MIMEELQARHRKEARDLQSRVTQKKKQASKKTRKGVNDECIRLEAELKERQARELAELDGSAGADGVVGNNSILTEELENLSLQVEETDGVATPSKLPNGSTSSNGTMPLDTTPVSPNGSQAASVLSQDTSSIATIAKKPNRAKARLARRAAEQEELSARAAEEAQNLPDLKSQERDRMLSHMQQRNLTEKEIIADGHCLYSAVADQLDQLSIPVGCTLGDKPVFGFRAVRVAAAQYIEEHEDDFAPFLEEPVRQYVHKVRDTAEWGGQLELIALARSYGVEICVLQDFGRVEKIEPGDGGSGRKEGQQQKEGEEEDQVRTVWLGYYKHGFGLGEHYNSLRRAN